MNDYREEIREKIDFIAQLGKNVVICLDNIERLGSKERIKNLFAVVNELFTDNIKKIYIYDEKEMEQLFTLEENSNKKDSNEFLNYISKYTFSKIEICQVSFEEILYSSTVEDKYVIGIVKDFLCKFNQKIIQCLQSDVGTKDFKNNSFKIYELIYGNNKQLNKTLLNKKLLYINNGVKNPRYINNLLSELKTYPKQREVIKYRLEYRIIRDFLINIKKEDVNTEEETIFDILNTEFIYKNYKKKENIIDDICLVLLFGVDTFFREYTDNFKRRMFYEFFFDNLNIKEIQNKENELLEKLKIDSVNNLFKIINYIIVIYPKNYVSEIIKFLKTLNSKYKIISENGVSILINLLYLEEYFDKLFPKIKIKRSVIYTSNPQVTVLEDEVRTYIEYSEEMRYLEKLFDFIPKNHGNVKARIEYLLENLEKNKNFLEKIKLYKKCKKILKMLDAFLAIEVEENTFEELDIKNIEGFYYSENDFFYNIKVEKDKMVIKTNKQQINILEKDILILENKYLEKLKEILNKEDSESKMLLSRIRLFLIQIEKFKNLRRDHNDLK